MFSITGALLATDHIEDEEDTDEKVSSTLSRREKIIYIGKKPMMNYVFAVLKAFNENDTDETVLKARGRAISRAVDVAEIANRTQEVVEVGEVKIGSEKIEDEDWVRTISTIDIKLKRKPKTQAKKKRNNGFEV